MYGGNTQTFVQAKQGVMKYLMKHKNMISDKLPHFDIRRGMKMETFTQKAIQRLKITRNKPSQGCIGF